MIVLAVDPGKTTGYAVWSGDKIVLAGQAPREEFIPWADGTIHAYQPWDLRVACEQFEISQRTLGKTADAYHAMWQIGCLDYFCRRDGVPFDLQKVGDAKSFATDEKLRRLDWYHATPGGHENDAKRHLMVYLVEHRRLKLKDLVEGATVVNRE